MLSRSEDLALLTGRLFVAACGLGARLGGLDEQDQAHLRAFGLLLGLAFQLADDALDCDGDVMRAVDLTIAVPVEKVVLMAATSGTTGEPTPYPHTERDNEVNSEVFARILWRTGLRPGNRVGASVDVPTVSEPARRGAARGRERRQIGRDAERRVVKRRSRMLQRGGPPIATHHSRPGR